MDLMMVMVCADGCGAHVKTFSSGEGGPREGVVDEENASSFSLFVAIRYYVHVPIAVGRFNECLLLIHRKRSPFSAGEGFPCAPSPPAPKADKTAG